MILMVKCDEKHIESVPLDLLDQVDHGHKI